MMVGVEPPTSPSRRRTSGPALSPLKGGEGLLAKVDFVTIPIITSLG
jgi:hypothetical protein